MDVDQVKEGLSQLARLERIMTDAPPVIPGSRYRLTIELYFADGEAAVDYVSSIKLEPAQ